MGLSCCCSAIPSSFAKSLDRARSGRAAMLPRARKHSDSLTSRSGRRVCYLAGRSRPSTRNRSRSTSVVKDPVCTVQMWNLSKNPAASGSMPSVNQPNPGLFIKPDGGLLLGAVDAPATRPLVSNGDMIFGFVAVDCPDCKSVRFYWLFFVYDDPRNSWYSEVPEGGHVNVVGVSNVMDQVDCGY